MKQIFGYLAAVVAAALVMPVAALAQAPSAASSVEALIITPLSLVKEQDLDFAYIIPSTTNGYVTLSPANVVTTSGGVTVTGTTQPAAFYGYGEFDQRVRLNLSANQYLLNRQGGPETMTLDQITIGSRPPVVLGTTPRTFRIASTSGLFRFTVGGRLLVRANQMPGVYVGQFHVIAEYI